MQRGPAALALGRLGFRGHFSTKSRAYSITLGSLRTERAEHQREQAIAAGLQPDLDPTSTLVLTEWHFAGRGHQPSVPPGSPDPPPGDQNGVSCGDGVGDVA